jgi:colicin import membrane protein
LRAVRRCAPFRVPAQFAPYYSDWKTLNVQFDLS